MCLDTPVPDISHNMYSFTVPVVIVSNAQKMARRSAAWLLLLLLTLTGTSLSQPHLNGRFRGGIIMIRPEPGGSQYQVI